MAVGEEVDGERGREGYDDAGECGGGEGSFCVEAGENGDEEDHGDEAVEEADGGDDGGQRDGEEDAGDAGEDADDAADGEQARAFGLGVEEGLVEVDGEGAREHEEDGVRGAELGGEDGGEGPEAKPAREQELHGGGEGQLGVGEVWERREGAEAEDGRDKSEEKLADGVEADAGTDSRGAARSIELLDEAGGNDEGRDEDGDPGEDLVRAGADE